MPDFSFNTIPPVSEQATQEVIDDPNIVTNEDGTVKDTETETVSETVNTGTEQATNTEAQTGTEVKQDTEVGTETETKPPETPDKFFEDFNTRFSTQYKTDDEIKGLFELPKKVSQYEKDLASKADLEKSVEQYKKDLDTVKRTEASKYLSTPTMQKAYVADQLLAKYPDKDPTHLTELVMSDTSKMSDLDLLAKEKKVNHPNLKIEDIKLAILDELGVDEDTPKEEWSTLVNTKLQMRADDARANIKTMTTGIELPKVETPEEVELNASEALAKRTEQAAPFKAEYVQFDKFDMGDGLDYTVPDDFKDKLGGMFDAFVNAGNDLNEENMSIIKGIRDASFFDTYKKEILEAMRKDADTKAQTKLDEKLANTTLPNTNTASDELGNLRGDLEGIESFKQSFRGQRVTQL